jgi:hypothetical protein
VSPVSVITEREMILDSPILHSALPTKRAPSRLNSFFVHISRLMPAPIDIISRWMASSTHIVDFCGGALLALLVVMVSSQWPDLSLG